MPGKPAISQVGGGQGVGGFNTGALPEIGYGPTGLTNFLDALGNLPQQYEKAEQAALQTRDLRMKNAQAQVSQLGKIARANPLFMQSPNFERQFGAAVKALGLSEIPRTADGRIDLDAIPGTGGFSDMTGEQQTAFRESDTATRHAMMPGASAEVIGLPRQYTTQEVTNFGNMITKAENGLRLTGDINQFIIEMKSLSELGAKMSRSTDAVPDVNVLLDAVAADPQAYISAAVANRTAAVNIQGVNAYSLAQYRTNQEDLATRRLRAQINHLKNVDSRGDEQIRINWAKVRQTQQKIAIEASRAQSYATVADAEQKKATAALGMLNHANNQAALEAAKVVQQGIDLRYKQGKAGLDALEKFVN